MKQFVPRLPVELEQLDDMAARATEVIRRLRNVLYKPDSQKRLDLRFNPGTAALMARVSEADLSEAEADGRLPRPDRPAAYTLSEVNAIRDVFSTRPFREKSDEASIIAVQNFKGGVAKTTMVCHLAQYLALRGYRVCVIDCDSQASTTTIFGFNPDVDVDDTRETIYPFLAHGGPETLDYTLKPTYWDGITLIPANLGLYDAEYELAARLRDDSSALDLLRQGIDTISDKFDVVLLDPPPALGMISLNVLRAANALIIPAPPNNIDFASTGHFIQMLASTMRQLSSYGSPPSYNFVRLLAAKMNRNKGAQATIKQMMDTVFPDDILEAVLLDSAEMDSVAAQLRTVYEVTGEDSHTSTHRRCRQCLDEIGEEIETLIRSTWPSHHDALVNEGKIR